MFYVLKKENSEIVNNIIDTKKCVCFYYWVNCGHCHQMMPIWMKLCKEYGKDVNIINIELSNIQYLNPQLRNVMGFPTILSYSNGIKKEEYNGMREHDSLKMFLMKYKIAKPVKAAKATKPVKAAIPTKVAKAAKKSVKSVIKKYSKK